MKQSLLTPAALLLLLLSLSVSAQDQGVTRADFKQELMPQVGRRITVNGVLQEAKLGWLIAFKDWGIYIYSPDSKHLVETSRLSRFSGLPVQVTGTLRFSPEPPPPAGDLAVATIPEHFYFDIAEANVVQRPVAIKESPRKPLVVSVAPAECISSFRQFFSYVQQDNPSIVTDRRAQERWLSKSLREALQQKVATFKDQPDDPDFPGNATFVGTWDKPTTFTLLGSRRYNNRAVLDVWYTWGKGTNYPGDTRLSYFIFVLEEGRWKLDDVYTFRGEFASAESLNAYLRSK